MKKRIDREAEYFEELFEHQRQVQEIHDEPLIGWKGFIGFLIFYGIIFYLGLHGYLGD